MVKIIIVDEDDNEIGLKERGTLDDSDIYRVSSLWIENSNDDILLAQRSFSKKKHPGKWGPAVAGTVDEGESYEDNIIKEAEEEIGLKDVEFVKGRKVRVRGKYNYFRQMFLFTTDMSIDEFVIQENEVEKIRWFSREKLKKEFEKNPDSFIDVVGELLKDSTESQ